MPTPQDKFKALIGQLGATLQELHLLCMQNHAPAEVTNLFSVAVEDRGTVSALIADTLAAHPPKFLED